MPPQNTGMQGEMRISPRLLLLRADELSESIMFAICKELTSMANPAAMPQVRVEMNFTQSPPVHQSHQPLSDCSPLPRHRPWRTRIDSRNIPLDRFVRKQWQKGHCPLPRCEDSHARANPITVSERLSHARSLSRGRPHLPAPLLPCLLDVERK